MSETCRCEPLIKWLVETAHYPFDISFSPPPPIDHFALADHWNAWDEWGITPDEAYDCVAAEAGLSGSAGDAGGGA